MPGPNSIRPIPGKPGKFFDPTANGGRGGVVTVVNARETDRYDTVEQASGQITAASTLKFFNDLNQKDDIDSNVPEANKVVNGSERLILERIGVSIQPAHSSLITFPRDVKRLVAAGHLEVKVNKQEIDAGPLEKFPAGYGLSGQTQENDAGFAQIGVPSTAAQAKFTERQIITDAMTVKGTISFPNRSWLTTSTMPTLEQAILARLYLSGLLEEAVGTG